MGDAMGSGGRRHQVAIIGTGFAGLCMAIRLKADGIDDFVILEKAGDVGGTWRDNNYPGCACPDRSHGRKSCNGCRPRTCMCSRLVRFRPVAPRARRWRQSRRCRLVSRSSRPRRAASRSWRASSLCLRRACARWLSVCVNTASESRPDLLRARNHSGRASPFRPSDAKRATRLTAPRGLNIETICTAGWAHGMLLPRASRSIWRAAPTHALISRSS